MELKVPCSSGSVFLGDQAHFNSEPNWGYSGLLCLEHVGSMNIFFFFLALRMFGSFQKNIQTIFKK